MKEGGKQDQPPRPWEDATEDLDEASEILADLDLPEPDTSGPRLQALAHKWSDRLAFDALSRISCSITANLDLPSLLRQILDSAIGVLGTERGVLFLGDDPDAELIPAVARSVDRKDLAELAHFSRTVLRQVISGRVVWKDDILSDPELRDVPSISVGRMRSVLCVPLQSRGRMRGALYLDNRSHPTAYPEAARRFLQAFAGLASVALENAELHGETLRENRRLRRRLESVETFGRIVTASPKMNAVLEQAGRMAHTRAPVMILGESGTGKELLARAIHEAGPRAGRPFIAYNCAAIPGPLMESIFFGHTRGAFTGAVRPAHGLFRLADQGVLFLDEVSDLESGLQAKLLRVLEDGIIRPVGGDAEIQVDVRLISATSGNLAKAIAAGRFREELFYRMSVLEIRLPPLRERTEDIPLLIDHLLRKHAPEGVEPIRFTPEAIGFLQSLPWRGNIRELQNFVQRALVLCPGPVAGLEEAQRLAPNASGFGSAEECREEGMDSAGLSAAVPERQRILEALRHSGGNRSAAARRLGMHRNTLLRRMKRLGIE